MTNALKPWCERFAVSPTCLALEHDTPSLLFGQELQRDKIVRPGLDRLTRPSPRRGPPPSKRSTTGWLRSYMCSGASGWMP
ncbi:hypothetical protein [Mycobacterium simiae]|uniref:hypothetical protein n=1 Tax=Mycobacterium simiae TaxID=1784 RepID=UPI00262D487C|nr:hypothetical protein [Mycobacterium simiae]